MQALGRQRQVDLCEFEASLVYRVSSRTAGVYRKPLPSKGKLYEKRCLLCRRAETEGLLL